MRVWTTSVALTAAMTVSAAALAQSSVPVTVPGGWSASAGYEVFEFRDISRNMNPPDASPVSWRGSGPVVTARFDSARARSNHIADVTVARAGAFDALAAEWLAAI